MTRQPWRLAVALIAAVLVPVALVASPTTITVFHVNDTHSHLDAFGPKDLRLDGTLGGLAKAATVLQEARNLETNSLLLHAGDAFVGDFYFNRTYGVAELSLLKALGLDAMTIGNHEFDLGPDVLTGTLSTVPGGPPLMLSANANTAGCDGTKCAQLTGPTGWIQPSTIITRGGVRIGVFGLTTPDDPTAQPAPVVIEGAGGAPDPDGPPNVPLVLVRAYVTASALRMAGAQVVILLSHLGMTYDQAIAANQPPLPPPFTGPLINFIVGGHDHLALEHPVVVGGTPIVSAGQFYEHVGRLRFTVDGPTVAFQDYALLPVERCVRPNTWVQSQVDVLKQQIVAFYKEDVYKGVVGWALRDILRDAPADRAARDTGMGNLIADAYRFKTGSDVSLVAAGYIADKLYRGPLVGADLFRTVPYGLDPVSFKDYPLVVVGMKGSELWKGVETTLAYLDITKNFFLQVSGVRYVYDSTQPRGARLLELTVNGKPVDLGKTYSVTMNYIVAMIAQSPAMDLQFESFAMAGMTEYDALRDWVKHVKVLWKQSEGRVVDVALTP